MGQAEFLTQVRQLSDRLVNLQTPVRILDAVKWDKAIRQDFFAHKCKRLPQVTPDYYQQKSLGFEPAELRKAFAELEREITRQIGQLSPISQLMRNMCREYRLVTRLLEARGSADFHDLSVELYGHPRDVFHAGDPSLAELAQMMEQPLQQLLNADVLPDEPRDIPAPAAVKQLQAQLDASMPGMQVQVMLSDGIVSDAAAGSDRIKLNQEVHFSQRELDLLEAHEGWIHVGTTQNGLTQPYLTFLSKGTPGATVTQEGLAVLTEIITLRSTPKRLTRLVNRIHAITLATDGADFMEVYRHFIDKGLPAEESFTMCERVFRGSLPELPMPFTKDLAYIKGFVLIYNLFRVAIQLGRIDHLPLLLVGKLQLDDFRLLSELYDQGIISAPSFVPPYFKDLRGLATWLSFGRFIGSLNFEQLEKDYRPLFN